MDSQKVSHLFTRMRAVVDDVLEDHTVSQRASASQTAPHGNITNRNCQARDIQHLHITKGWYGEYEVNMGQWD